MIEPGSGLGGREQLGHLDQPLWLKVTSLS